ncbi:thioredoxin-like domain-containing protein [Jatrophihabitans sp.]|uniref:thioredoxin-like domain-containing protein n=1 Tax=Jatrophihabitans sp. TaxID=1932789 RepID=UPI0030C66719|nr:alkyl hydroperoxide reductase/Thiol specific antioxidant/Mal allergen [Jatrophihabitans sp.]
MSDSLHGPRVRAPQYPEGGRWFNTDHPLSHAELRGRFQLLDFWTFCCANCLHVIDELRPLEEKYADILTVIGVHSPKFDHERSDAAVGDAIERYDVEHPVLNDPDLHLWRQYAVRAWPTLVLVDPEGYVVAQAAGEGQTSALDAMIAALAAEHEAKGTLHRGAGVFVAPVPQPTALRFPAKAIVLPPARTGRDEETLLVADAGHHQLVELDLAGEQVLRRIGTGVRGRTDGPTPSFAEPGGLALLPPGYTDYDVVVADTANHLLRGVRLSDGAVVATIDLAAAAAGLATITGTVPGVLSPWDVVWWAEIGSLVVAAAGVHLLLAVDPADGSVRILAGTTVEGLRDGPALDAWLAQPSGLAVDGNQLWFVDSETSSLRSLSVDGELITVVGEGLFDFGHVDGHAIEARLQHPLGVTLLADGTVAIADTYNGAIRRYDPWTATVSTLATDLAEPSGAVLVGEDLVVIESAAHRLVRPVPRADLVAGEPMRTPRPVTDLAPGTLTLRVRFDPPPGRKLDERFGPSTLLTVNSSPPGLLVSGAVEGPELTVTLELSDEVDEGVLHITAQAASCDDDTAENPACYLARQDWGVPVRLTPDGPHELSLMLLG